MPDSVPGVFRSLAVALTDLAQGRSDVVPVLTRIGQACRQLLPVQGVSISAIGSTDDRRVLYASDDVIERVEAVQFSLGEGPCYEAFSAGRPVLVSNIATDAAPAWPVFAAHLADESVGALFAFPLGEGAARLGALTMYRRSPGWLTTEQVRVSLKLADLAAASLIAALAPPGEVDSAVLEQPWFEVGDRGQYRVHQATGMVMAALHVPAGPALSMLRGHAFATGRLVEEIAEDLVARRTRPEDLLG